MKKKDLYLSKIFAQFCENAAKRKKSSTCVTLAGKPKLFFINACQGGLEDAGYLVANPQGDKLAMESALTKACILSCNKKIGFCNKNK